MWILSFLSPSIIHILVVIGLLGTLASFVLGAVPFIKQYKLVIQIVSIALLAFSIYLEGGLSLQAEYESKIKDMQVVMANAATKAALANSALAQKYADAQAATEANSNTITRYIEKETIKIDRNCRLSPEVIIAHNAAATDTPIDEAIKDHNAAAQGD